MEIRADGSRPPLLGRRLTLEEHEQKQIRKAAWRTFYRKHGRYPDPGEMEAAAVASLKRKALQATGKLDKGWGP